MKLKNTETRITIKMMSLKMTLKLIKYNIMIDRMIAGRVNKSPNAAIIGLVMLSGSQPCSKLLNDMNIVIGSMIRFDIIPAITQINMKSIMDIEGWCKIRHRIFATNAKNIDKISVKTKEE